MAGNNDIKKEQGAIKLEEIRLNRAQEVIETNEEFNALTALEQIRLIAQDTLRRAGLILTSSDPVEWTGDEIKFQSEGNPSDINLKLLQNEASTSRTITLKLTGTTGPAGAQAFNEIPLADGEVLYLQLNRETILQEAADSLNLTGEIVIENAIDGGSLVTNKTALKSAATKAAGVPSLKSPIGGNSDTFNIPLAICLHRGTQKDLWWIPHGIRWPMGTTSVLGAVVVEGIQAYPNVVVGNEAQLGAALGVISSGGVIVLDGAISLNLTHNIPSGVRILGRLGGSSLFFNPGSKIVLADDSQFSGVRCIASSSFTGNMVEISGDRILVEASTFDMALSSTATGIHQTGSYYRIDRCKFVNVETTNTGINYTNTNPGVDIDSTFL